MGDEPVMNNLLNNKDEKTLTSLNRVYKRYIEFFLKTEEIGEIPIEMDDLFPDRNGQSEEGNRIAVWNSDMNKMGDMLPLWLSQEEEDVLKTFDSLKDLFIDVIASTLDKVFPESEWFEKKKEEYIHRFIPFRLIVAGGDDLCIVMPEKYILKFTETYSSKMCEALNSAGRYHKTLTLTWLQETAKKLNEEARKKGRSEKEYNLNNLSFGGSFIVTPIHTPFTKIHEVGEELMGQAKKQTNRAGNSINWRILAADEEPQSEKILKAERPLLIEERYGGLLSFKDYLDLCNEYKDISGSHLHQIIKKVIEFDSDQKMIEHWLLRMPEAGKKDSVISRLINDERLRDEEGEIKTGRLVTLFELLTLY